MKKGHVEMLTARQFSERAQVSYPTVMKWLRAGLIPGAKLNENTPLGTYWEIPATSVGKITKQKPGPKPKNTSAVESDDNVESSNQADNPGASTLEGNGPPKSAASSRSSMKAEKRAGATMKAKKNKKVSKKGNSAK
jgi:hypothetical protein